MEDLDEIAESSEAAPSRSAPLQIAVVAFTGAVIAVIWLVADPLGSSSGVVVAGSVAVTALLALAAVAAVRDIRAARFGADTPEVDMPPPGRVKLRWIWLIGLPAVPLFAIGLTLVFMNPDLLT